MKTAETFEVDDKGSVRILSKDVAQRFYLLEVKLGRSNEPTLLKWFYDTDSASSVAKL